MKCHLCVNYIEMQTDPATCDYVIVSGARRKEERWDMAENEQILTTGKTVVIIKKTNCLVSALTCTVCKYHAQNGHHDIIIFLCWTESYRRHISNKKTSPQMVV